MEEAQRSAAVEGCGDCRQHQQCYSSATAVFARTLIPSSSHAATVQIMVALDKTGCIDPTLSVLPPSYHVNRMAVALHRRILGFRLTQRNALERRRQKA